MKHLNQRINVCTLETEHRFDKKKNKIFKMYILFVQHKFLALAVLCKHGIDFSAA
jgi:hypothetical protein